MRPRQAVSQTRSPEPLCYAVVSTRAAERYGRLPVEARAVLRLCDGTRTLDAICAAAPGAATPRIVRRLQSLGLIAALPLPRRRRDTPSEVLRWCQGTAEQKSPLDSAVAALPAPIAAQPAPVAAAPEVAAASHFSDEARVAATPTPGLVTSGRPEAATAAHFSDEEEAFFSAPLPEELPWDVDLAR